MAATPQRAAQKVTARPGDATALKKEQLEAERDARLAEEALANQTEAERAAFEAANNVIDYSGSDTPLPEIVESEVERNEPYRTILIKHPIDQMTFGREIIKRTARDEKGNEFEIEEPGNIRYFSFTEGRRYRVPRALADHLDERGFVYH